MRFYSFFILFFTLTLLACAATDGTYKKSGRYSRDQISNAEIQDNSASNAYDLLRSLRPHWLSGRGSKSILYDQASYPVVYVNDSKHGDVNSLSNISTANITTIRFLNSSDAANRYGQDHAGGAILITLF